MNVDIQLQKLEELKDTLVPSLFTARQLNVLIKRLKQKKLTQPEKNYLSNAIKAKIKAINAIKHININELYSKRRNINKINKIILVSYQKSGLELIGSKKQKRKSLSATDVVKSVISNYENLDSRLLSLLPVYITKNITKINLYEIFHFAIENNLTNIVGYLLDIVYNFYKNSEIKRFLDSLKNKKNNTNTYLDARYKNAEHLIIQDKISRRWNIYTLNTINDYRIYFEEYN
jgi:hypothetical protein